MIPPLLKSLGIHCMMWIDGEMEIQRVDRCSYISRIKLSVVVNGMELQLYWHLIWLLSTSKRLSIYLV